METLFRMKHIYLLHDHAAAQRCAFHANCDAQKRHRLVGAAQGCGRAKDMLPSTKGRLGD
jgi:hypothetical protein